MSREGLIGKAILVSVALSLVLGTALADRAQAAPPTVIKNWKATSTFVPSIEDAWNANKYFIDLVEKSSNGRIKIELHPAGAIAAAYETLDVVSKNVAQVGFDWAGYWAGKNRAFDVIGSVPWFTPPDYFVWAYHRGGLDLLQQLYGRYNVVAFPCFVTSSESGWRTAKKPLVTLDDYKGMRLRTSSMSTIYAVGKLGGSAVNLPGGEIYTAMERGLVDGIEWSSPAMDWTMGFAEITKYWTTPHPTQPASLNCVFINKDEWNKLPDDLKAILKTCAQATSMWGWTLMESTSPGAVRKFVGKGIKIVPAEEKTTSEVQRLASEYYLTTAKKVPDVARVLLSQLEYLEDYSQWRSMQKPFGFGTNVSYLSEMLKQLRAIAKK